MFSFPDYKLKYIESSINFCNVEQLPKEEREFALNLQNPLTRKRFIAGRCAAHEALIQLNMSFDGPILKNKNGAPIWPNDVVGSISHSHDYAVAAVSFKKDYRAIGIDLEFLGRQINPSISKKILLPSEYAWVSEVPDLFKVRLISIFSAKEAIYKALSDIGAPVFWFQEVTLTPISYLNGKTKFNSKISKPILESCKLEIAPSTDVYTSEFYILSICTVS